MKNKNILRTIAAITLSASASFGALGLTACGGGHTHSYEWYKDDPNQHWKVCPDDGEIDESTRGDHDYSNGDCVCGRPKPGSSNPGTDPGTDPGTPDVEKMSVYERADYLARAVDDHYATYSNGDIFAAGYYNALEGGTEGYANCYEYSALITMANKILSASTDEAQKTYYKKLLDGYVAGLDNYEGKGTYTSTHGTRLWEHLYGVHRKNDKNTGDVSTDMVYDDLMWIIRDFVEIYHTTGDATYISRAEHMTSACLDGWDSTKGGIGGITWGPTYESKHTCSNGPIISALCGLADYYKDKDDKITAEETVYGEQTFALDRLEWENMVGMKKYDYYLKWAKKVYDFTYSYLRDSDYTFVDLVRQDGAKQIVEDKSNPSQTYNYFKGDVPARTEGETFTYNTGSVISGAAWLYRLTGDVTYLTQGRLMAEGANHFFAKTVTVDGKEMQMYDCRASLLFNEVLMQGFYDLAKASKIMESDIDAELQKELAGYVNVFKTSIEYAFSNYLVNRTLPQNYLQGWLYAGDGGAQTKDTHKDLKDAAATPAILAIIASYEAEHGELSDIIGEQHQHSYTEWGKSATEHWKFCVDDNVIDESTRAPHTYDDASDTTCNDCGYVRQVVDPSVGTGTLSGVVTASGQAVIGATVTVDGKESVKTNANGEYTVEGISVATTTEIDITVTAEGYYEYSGKVSVEAGSASITKDIELTLITVAELGDKPLAELNSMNLTVAADYNFLPANKGGSGLGDWMVSTTSYDTANEGLLLHEAGQDIASGSTDLKLFAYKRYTFTEMQQIKVRATRFSDSSHNPNLQGGGYPEVYILLVAEDGTVIKPVEAPGEVINTDPGSNEFAFTLSESITGNYVLAVGTTRGNRVAIQSVRFLGEEVRGTITGKILRGDAGLNGATVSFGATEVQTNENGEFSISVTVHKGGEYALTVSHGGVPIEIPFTADNLASGNYGVGDVAFKAVLPGLTTDDIEDLTPCEKTQFNTDGGKDEIRDAWRTYGNVDKHSEGACIHLDSNNPVSYVYAKFDISADNSYMKFKARMFVRDSDRATGLQVKVIKADGTVDVLAPTHVYRDGSNVITSNLAADGKSVVNDKDAYTEGAYDLSAYNGQTVVIVIQAVYLDGTDYAGKAVHNAISEIAFKETPYFND